MFTRKSYDVCGRRACAGAATAMLWLAMLPVLCIDAVRRHRTIRPMPDARRGGSASLGPAAAALLRLRRSASTVSSG